MSTTKNPVEIEASCSPGGGSCFAPADAVISTLEDNRPGRLLDRAERLILGLRLTLALAALCLVAVAEIVVQTLGSFKMRYPKAAPEVAGLLEDAKAGRTKARKTA